MNILKIQKLDHRAHAPEKAHPGDLGYDLFALDAVNLPAGEMRRLRTGVAVEFPEGWGGVIKDRSSMASKRIVTSGGVIDHGYRGEILVLVSNLSGEEFAIAEGQKIAQLVPCHVTNWQVEVAEELNGTSRGANGFGSTGAHKVRA
ncbi:MAG: dUTP diphosphatase [Nitrospinae bacterium]|nr:dUTP diphosphatase [Nitrospinota bacterium]